MTFALRWCRSLIFVVQMYLAMVVYALIYVWPAILSRDWAWRGVHAYCAWVRLTARVIVGIKTEIRGSAPQDPALIAAKHQSFLDIILICSAVPRPKFIMKRELIYAPILGWFALRIGCIPVNRGKKGAAIASMQEQVRVGAQTAPGQLIIYPQGTRVAPGAEMPYKVGVGTLYAVMDQPCVPAATNVGLFWPRKGILRKPGLAVVEFLDPVPPGMAVDAFMSHIRGVIEPASDRLMAEAGFTR